MGAVPRLALAVLVLAPTVLGQPADAPPLYPLPDLDLSRTEPALAAQIEGLEDLIENLRGQGAPAPQRAEAWGTLGHLYFYYGFLDAAADAYANAQALVPREPRWPYHRGVVAADRGDPERAGQHFAAVLERSPDLPPALVRLGRTELDQDRPGAAAGHFARAAELAPGLAAAWEGLGRARLNLGELDGAVSAFETALQRQPRATAIRFPLAQALRRRGEPGDLEAARAHLDRWGDVQVALTDPYMDRMGQATALSSYGLVRSLAPRREEFPDLKYFRFALGTLEGLQGAAERLAQDLRGWPAERLEDDAVARARLYHVLGGLAGQAGRPEEAAELYGQALGILPGLDAARVERAQELLELGRRDEARSELERVFGATLTDAQERDPTFVEGRLLLAKLLLSGGAGAPAREHFDRVAVHRPDSPEPWLGGAAARLLEGRRAEATETLERGLETVTDPAGRETLSDLLVRWRQAPPEATPDELLEGIL